jgi:hypothetical protein
METKRDKIKALVVNLLEQSHEEMYWKIDAALNSGAIDIDSWQEDDSPMVLPKIIITAILENESTQYQGKGTSFEKKIKKEVKNLRYFI